MRRRQFPFKDAQSFSQLWEQAHLTVYRYIYVLCGGPVEGIENLTAETLWRVWRARQRFEDTLPASIAWLLKIARRLVIDSYHRDKIPRCDIYLNCFTIKVQKATPEEKVQHNEQLRILLQLLQELPVHQRDHHFEHMV
jgi:RNA polymerase sigma factor (sigma-70 family)